MRTIDDPSRLEQGATLYHAAFGFAVVDAVHPDAVDLTWERSGPHLPSQVRHDHLARVYSRCAPDGFFHRALHHGEALRQALHDRPADALVWLLDDLDQPQRLRDVMDWLVGRELFNAKTFVRWWGATAQAAVQADPRLAVEGEWLHRRTPEARDEGPPALVQLEPGAVEPHTDDTLDDPWDVLVDPTDEAAFTDEALLESAPVSEGPLRLGEASPAAGTLPRIGLEMARAVARRLEGGKAAAPSAWTATLHADGTIRLPEAEGPPRPAHDVRAAAIAVLEAFLGRPLPSGTEPADVLPHLRHRLPTLPPSSLAPLASALRPDPTTRPTPEAWVAQWRQVVLAETGRPEAWEPRAYLRAGYDSHVGRVKLLLTQVNQDALFVGTRGHHGVFVVADGISIADAGRGDLASWIVVQTIQRLWSALPADRVDPRRLLDRALQLANRSVCEQARHAAGGHLEGRLPMGTTATAVQTAGNRVHLTWVGDSRAYLVGPYGAAQVTADDNVSGETFLAWCARETRHWDAQGHALTRYVGHFDESWEPAPFPAHHTSFVLRPGERLLLTSDGITDYLAAHEAEIVQQIADLVPESADLDRVCRDLVSEANARGGGDNATAILLAQGAGQRADRTW